MNDNLAFTIRNYFDKHLTSLKFNKQIHFLIRMYLFTGETFYYESLVKLQGEYIGITKEEQEKIIKESLTSVIPFSKEYSRRNEFLTKYPEIRIYETILVKYIFAKKIYQVDLKEVILSLVPAKQLLHFALKLSKDKEAIFYFSTVSVNFFYLLHQLLNLKQIKIYANAFYFYRLVKSRDLQNIKYYSNLAIYIATHCIVCATNFYTKKIIEDQRIYIKLLQFAEKEIIDNYPAISLDEKLELLVCSKILNYKCKLSRQILAESDNSLNKLGYLVDKKFGEANFMNDPNFSEHRNALYLMNYYWPPKV